MSEKSIFKFIAGLLLWSLLPSSLAEVQIGGYQLLSQQRIDRFTYQLEYQAQATNSADPVTDVSATLATDAPGVSIVDGSLSFGDIAAGATVTSGDTFILYVDRRYPLNEADLRWNVSAGRFVAIADCSPLAGPAPLNVRFRSRGEFTGGSIVRYRWDFNGDGVYETSDPVARDYTRTYTQPGVTTVSLQVTNNFNATATDTCDINVDNRPPILTASIDPTNGEVPLFVTLTCTAADYTNGQPMPAIALYEWDFDGDGAFDYTSSSSGITNHTYNTEGEFEALCQATDVNGLSALARATTTVVRIGPPGTPQINAFPERITGVAPLTAYMNASVQGPPIDLWEWDFDGDGVFDYSSTSSASASYTYTQGGVFGATVRATNRDGLTSLDTIEVLVTLSSSLSVPDDTFDPSAGETATVRTQLSGEAETRVYLRDGDGNRVATLFSGQRPGGTYDDVWDGTDDLGDALPQGAYYAILEYDFEGEVVTLDLSNSTGGIRYNPSRTRFPRTFDPYSDDLLDVTFTIPSNRGASEVEAFVGLFNVNTRIINLLNRDPLGVGSHTIAWDGHTPEGEFAVAPPGDRFLFGIFAYTLPDNAIMLQRAPELSDLTTEPNFYNASVPNYLTMANNIAVFTFSLNKIADIEVAVTNLETGSLIRDYRVTGLSAGAGNSVSWDGKANDGRFADEGEYRITLTAIDSTGSRSISRAALVRVQH